MMMYGGSRVYLSSRIQGGAHCGHRPCRTRKVGLGTLNFQQKRVRCSVSASKDLAARVSLDQLRWEGKTLWLEPGFVYPVENELDHLLAQLLWKFADGGQPRIEPGPDGIVTTDNADVIGNLQSAISQTLVNTMCGRIITGKDRGNGFAARQ